ncbi:MAG TPA: hypothetical protein VJ952_01450, partial [Opitutales bacterium]|nr:hypothetical protein [Opitutales bacterium]
MKDKEPPNPFEEIQKQLKDLFKDTNVKVSTHAYDPSGAMDDEDGESAPPDHEKNEEVMEQIRNFRLKPKEIRDYLNRFVIRQDDAKKVLSVAICDHYNHVRQCLENPKLLEKD